MAGHSFVSNTLSGLYGITDHQLMPDDDTLMRFTECALRGGMRIVQYRNKSRDVTEKALLRQTQALLALCRAYDALFIVNDRVELARTVCADGVHLGLRDAPLQETRAYLGPQAIIGITCGNSLSTAYEATLKGANYVAFGQFFHSETKECVSFVSHSTLLAYRQRCMLPIAAIGGITVENCPSVLAAGANMIATVRGLFATDDIRQRAQQFVRCINT